MKLKSSDCSNLVHSKTISLKKALRSGCLPSRRMGRQIMEASPVAPSMKMYLLSSRIVLASSM